MCIRMVLVCAVSITVACGSQQSVRNEAAGSGGAPEASSAPRPDGSVSVGSGPLSGHSIGSEGSRKGVRGEDVRGERATSAMVILFEPGSANVGEDAKPLLDDIAKLYSPAST